MTNLIVTISDYTNYGNRLQNYALTQLLSDAYGETTTARFQSNLPTFKHKLVRNAKKTAKRLRANIVRGQKLLDLQRTRKCVAFTKRYIPDEKFFSIILKEAHGRLYLTRYHDYVIGCSAVVYSQQNAYLWYTAFRRKSFAFVHPDELTLWHVLKDSHSRGYQHVFFLDVGLPFSHNPFREFILRFGGKPVSTYRWFRCSIHWINAILSWIYRD